MRVGVAQLAPSMRRHCVATYGYGHISQFLEITKILWAEMS